MEPESTVTLKTTTGVILSIDEFNALRRAEPYKRLIEDGWLDLELICYYQSVRLTVNGKTTVRQLTEAAKALMEIPDFGKEASIRNTQGTLLEPPRRLEELALSYGERLFIS
jgi:hypothetical protein